jgi:formylglycine-generating enzyme required for sulfatase activity
MEKNEKMVVVPDDFKGEDKLGFDAYSSGLVEMIRSVEANGSFTIGLYGEWGQGKTSMLRLIEDGIENKVSHDGKEILTVWFDPWQYSSEEHVIIPFFHTLASYLEAHIKGKKKKKDAKPVGRKVLDFLKLLSQVPVAIAYGTEFTIKAPLIVESKFKFKDAIENAKKKSQPAVQKEVKKYESMYYRLISTLQTSAKDLGLKIVVFIDDLDRCLPEKAVELLEGIKVFLDLSGFVFVLAVARDVIELGIKYRHRQLYNDTENDPILKTKDYMDKIIQFSLAMPTPAPELLEDMLEESLKDMPEIKPYISTIQRSMGSNPRSLKRFINTITYNFWVAKNKSIGDRLKEELLIKIILILFIFPDLYKVIQRTPSHLLKIQARLEEEQKLIKADGDNPKLAAARQIRTATEFTEINDLNLFNTPNYEKITEILGLYERREMSIDEGFANEEEVRKYLNLLSATSGDVSEALETGAFTGADETAKTTDSSVLQHVMANRMIPLEGGHIVMREEDSDYELSTRVPPFLLDKYPVTQDLYEKVLGKDKNRSRFPGGDRPVENVSWFDAVKFCNLLSRELGLNPVYAIEGEKVMADFGITGIRLPSETEWELACRGGTDVNTDCDPDKTAWHKQNSNGSTQGVGKKEPNPLGLYDMLGNVWEWCWDRHGNYPGIEPIEWRGPKEGPDRVFRGGSWNNSPGSCRADYRLSVNPSFHDHDLGFRLARSLTPKPGE